MRLYTVEKDGMTMPAILWKEGMYSLESFGIKAKDMNEVIENFSENEILIKEALTGKLPEAISDYRILSPILAPRQDVLCLGVNYHDHIEETRDVIDFTKKAALNVELENAKDYILGYTIINDVSPATQPI